MSQFQLASTTCTSSLAVGASCAAQIAFSPSSAGLQTGSLTVSSSTLATSAQVSLSGMGFDFSVSPAGQSSRTVSSGQTASFTITLATMSGSSGTFSFACSSLPSNSACSFNPTSVVIAANATGSATVQIATGHASTSAQNGDHIPGTSSSRILFVALALFAFPFAFSRKRHKLFWVVTIFLSSLGMMSCAGAGGGGGGAPPPSSANTNTPPGTYSVVVTATANGLSHKVTLTLTVD